MECRNCHNFHAVRVYAQTGVATYQNVLMNTRADALNAPHGDLDLHYCSDCSFLFNASFDDALVGYGAGYENSQNFSDVFVEHVKGRVNRVLSYGRTTDRKILEVGCGDGYFLRQLVTDQNGNTGTGYDKCLSAPVKEDHITLWNRYYDEQETGDFDIVVSRHVAEHIEDNNPLMNLIREKNPEARYFFETPSLEWIIQHETFYDIFYEHCSLFTRHSLAHLFQRNGINVQSVDTVFGDQYLWLEGGANKPNVPIEKTLNFEDVSAFFEKMTQMHVLYREKMAHDFKGKRISIWGAGAKGVTFANLIDPDSSRILSIVDINPRKAGKFLPGSGHSIIAPDVFLENPADVLLIMNPNYEAEIKQVIGDRVKTYITV